MTRRAGRPPLLAVALAVPLALLATACSAADEAGSATDRLDSDPRPRSTAAAEVAPETGFPDTWQPEPLDWQDCDVASDGQCARLRVPRDWDAPDGPTIELALGRTLATGDRIGSLLLNPGGPGASGLRYLGYEPFGPQVSSRFDVVAWDPRGVGSSTSFACGSGVARMLELDPDPDDPAEQAALEAAAADVSTECAERDGALLPHVGTRDVARDLEAIRRALGPDPLNYVGFSYGTQIGQTYAEMFPDEVRAMVLDGVVDPALGFVEFLLGQTAAFDLAFEENADACAAAGPDVCGVADLRAAYDEVLEAAEAAPADAGDDTITPSTLITGTIMTGYTEDGWAVLGPALADALSGRGRALRALAEGYWDFGGYTSYAAVVCIDSPPPATAEAYRDFASQAERVSPRFGASVANEMLPCATWPAEAVDEPRGITAPGAPPILVIGNTGDPATPYENAVTVAERLESGVLVTADMGGHTAYGSNRCVTDLVDAYLLDLQVPAPGARCT